jgi:hypothetical protein
VDERSKTRVCSRSLAEIAGLNPTGGMGVCLYIVIKDKQSKMQDNQDKEPSKNELQSTREYKKNLVSGMDVCLSVRLL